MQLDFKVNEQIITHENPEKKVVADSIKYLTCKFTFSEEWNGITKTAIFISASGDVYNVILDKNETCNVPYEVIKYPHFIISIFGGDRITANKFVIDVAKSGYCKGETPKEPTPDVYAQILSKLDGIEVGEVDEEQIKEVVNEMLKSIPTITPDLAQTDPMEADFVRNKKVSYLENDSGYLTEHQDISGKADKFNTYTKDEVKAYVNTQTEILRNDVEVIQNAINNEAHFRGYLSTNAKIQALEATPNDFTYSAESNTKWVYDAEKGWQDTGVTVPDQLTPASEKMPLMNGVASTGEEQAYARGDHRHPTDETRASVEELNELKSDIGNALDRIIAIEKNLITAQNNLIRGDAE